jgi:hypothetical protein
MQLLVLIAMPLSVGQPSQNDSTARIAETRWPVTSTQPNGFRPAAWSTARERRAPTLSGRVDVTVPSLCQARERERTQIRPSHDPQSHNHRQVPVLATA